MEQKRILFVILFYRHPNTSLQSFLDHFSKILDKFHEELCVVMGDFNINLLNCDSHALTGEFINLLFSYFLSTTYTSAYLHN